MKGKGKGKETAAATAVAGKVKEAEEKVEAWMVSVSDDSEESSEEDSLLCFNSMSDLFEVGDSLPDLQYLSDSDNETDASGDLKSKTVNSKEEPLLPSIALPLSTTPMAVLNHLMTLTLC